MSVMFSAFFVFLSFILPSHASPLQPSTFDGTDGSITLSDTPAAASLDEVPYYSPLLSCELDGRPPKVSDCVLLVNSHIQDSDFQITYIYGRGRNYSGPYTWRHNECEFELVVRTGDRFESTLRWIFGMALLVGTTCANRDIPCGGSAVLNDGWAVIYVRNPQGSSLPSTINSFSAHGGTANISSPAIHSRNCVLRDPGPSFNDCFTLFMDEATKPDSTTIQTFGARGTHRGSYSWVHGACGFQLGMNEVPFLATTLLWIFQTAVHLMLECTRLSPPKGGIAFLDHPYRGAFVRAFRPPALVSQQKRSLPPPSPLSPPHAFIFNNTAPETIQCVHTMPSPNHEDCFLLRANNIHRPVFNAPTAFGPDGNYTGPYAWEYGQCRFSLAVVGSCSWEASISEVFRLAATVWWECGRFEPPWGGYIRMPKCEGKTTVYVWAVGVVSGVGGGSGGGGGGVGWV